APVSLPAGAAGGPRRLGRPHCRERARLLQRRHRPHARSSPAGPARSPAVKARTLGTAAAGVAAVTIASRLVGFGRVAVLSHTVGTSCVGDTYQAANSIPNVVFEIVAGGALASLVVPVL